ncbi:MAG: HlyD family efflux transporter periplasmic adaptor subunit [Candidatus Schekmanbacteria bacterium]|nr:HlyD family efflux transporter periplasmic adaptor subunit [Candidatus Schekmanbacteria bacterium]
MKKKRRIARWIALAVLAAGVGYSFYPQAVTIEVVRVDRGAVRSALEEAGRTRVRNRHVVTAPVAGTAGRIALEVGDTVVAGQTIVTLTPPMALPLDARQTEEAGARVAAARAALAVAGEELAASVVAAELAAAQRARLEALAAHEQVAAEAVQTAVGAALQGAARQRAAAFAVEVARQEVAAAEAAARWSSERVRRNTTVLEVRSPVAGRVLARFRQSAAPIQAGEPLVEIGDTADLEVVVDLLSADAVVVFPGMPVRLLRWGGGEVLDARVRLIEPAGHTRLSALGVEEQRVPVVLDFTSPLSQYERLGDSFRVEANFTLWEGPDVLRVTDSALFRRGDGWAAFVVEEGRARARAVGVGHRGERFVEILDGLREGELVIVHPDDRIAEGARVTWAP